MEEVNEQTKTKQKSLKVLLRTCFCSRATIIRLSALLTLVIVLVVLAATLPVKQLVNSFLVEVEELGPVGPIVFIIIYCLCNILFIPGTILNLASGYIFGLGPGFAYVWIGASLGSTCCFFLGKLFFRYWATFFNSNFKLAAALTAAVNNNAIKIILLLRLSPIMPYMVLNYSMGIIEGLAFWRYLVPTVFGMIPGVLLYVYIGSVARDLTQIVDGSATDSTIQAVLLFGGLIFTVISVGLISYFAAREIKKELAKNNDDEQQLPLKKEPIQVPLEDIPPENLPFQNLPVQNQTNIEINE